MLEVHQVTQTDRCHRPVVLPDNPSHDIGRYHFHERLLHIYRIFFSQSGILRSKKIRDIREIVLRPSRAFPAMQIPLTYSYIDILHQMLSALSCTSVLCKISTSSLPQKRVPSLHWKSRYPSEKREWRKWQW